MSTDSVHLDIENGVATVTLDRPDQYNALSDEIRQGLTDALDRIEDGDVRCVVLEATGPAFSAGGDIQEMSGNLDDHVMAEVETERAFGDLIVRLVEFPVPTVAKIDGSAVAAGANLALACDIQLASEDAIIGFGFNEVGLTLDTGSSYFLPRIVGLNKAKELAFTGEMLDAEEAHDLGLVNHVYPTDEFDEAVAELVAEIAEGPTLALEFSKRLLNDGLDASIEEAVEAEAVAQGLMFKTADGAEGIEAFLDHRDPAFDGE